MSNYICPMHPQITSDKSGRCPECGMNLEQVSDHEEMEMHESHNMESHEKHRSHSEGMHEGHEKLFKKNFFIGIPFTLIILALSPKIQEWFHYSLKFTGVEFVIFLLASCMVFYLARPFYEMGWEEIKTRKFGMMTLVSLAVLSGYFFSVAATFLFHGESLYWEISTLVLAFLFGHWIEMRSVRSATGALTELVKLIPANAHLMKGEDIIEVKTESLKIGDVILVKPGEKIPIDGEVKNGESTVNEAFLTGESKPVGKKIGDLVIGGSINRDGALTIKVSKIGADTAISQMMKLIQDAQKTKPNVQKLADKAATVLTFTAIIVGSGAFMYWFFINPHGAVLAATLAISVIVITCPHALGLAIPTVTTITASLAAKNGILLQNMNAVEVARKITYVVFDKTGTLTKGNFAVTKIISKKGFTENEILELAASIEINSQHSIASGILKEAKRKKLKFQKADKFVNLPGKGAKGKIGKDEILVGNKSTTDGSFEVADVGTVVYVTKNNETIGAIILSDEIRTESKQAVAALHKKGIKVAMLTGDKKEVADGVSKKLSIDTIFSEVLPGDKVAKIKELQEKGNVVAMVGDGVNDAASLTQANLGIAIGSGTNVAMSSAEIVLVRNDPRDVMKAIKLSQKTNSKMVQNLMWATGYNVIAIPLAAGVLLSYGIVLRPEWSALVMSASSVIVVANALLLKKVRL